MIQYGGQGSVVLSHRVRNWQVGDEFSKMGSVSYYLSLGLSGKRNSYVEVMTYWSDSRDTFPSTPLLWGAKSMCCWSPKLSRTSARPVERMQSGESTCILKSPSTSIAGEKGAQWC